MRIVNSLVRTIGEEAKMAGVPLKTGVAATKNGPIRLDSEVIQESLGSGKNISSDLAKHTSLNSSFD